MDAAQNTPNAPRLPATPLIDHLTEIICERAGPLRFPGLAARVASTSTNERANDSPVAVARLLSSNATSVCIAYISHDTMDSCTLLLFWPNFAKLKVQFWHAIPAHHRS